jgi:Cu/Ag efflux pump CusA
MACTLIGGTAAGTVLTLLFLPALYAIWFRVRKPTVQSLEERSLVAA